MCRVSLLMIIVLLGCLFVAAGVGAALIWLIIYLARK